MALLTHHHVFGMDSHSAGCCFLPCWLQGLCISQCELCEWGLLFGLCFLSLPTLSMGSLLWLADFGSASWSRDEKDMRIPDNSPWWVKWIQVTWSSFSLSQNYPPGVAPADGFYPCPFPWLLLLPFRCETWERKRVFNSTSLMHSISRQADKVWNQHNEGLTEKLNLITTKHQIPLSSFTTIQTSLINAVGGGGWGILKFCFVLFFYSGVIYTKPLISSGWWSERPNGYWPNSALEWLNPEGPQPAFYLQNLKGQCHWLCLRTKVRARWPQSLGSEN